MPPKSGRGQARGPGRGRGRGRGGAVHVDLPSPLKTRPSNKNTPSLAEPKQARRTAVEMERSRSEKAAQEAAAVERQHMAVQKVASLEDSMHREDAARKLERFTGPSLVHEGEMNGDVADPVQASRPMAVVAAGVDTAPKHTDLGSAVPDSDGRALSLPVIGELGEDAGQASHADGAAEGKDASARAKKLRTTRGDVEAQRTTSDKTSVDTMNVDSKSNKKRKTVAEPNVPAKKVKKGTTKPGGLTLPAARSAKSRTVKGGVKKDDDDSMSRFGGIVDDDEDVAREREGTINSGSGLAEVKIEATPTTPLVSQPAAQLQVLTKKQARGGRNKWTLFDLPASYRPIFGSTIVPIFRSIHGTLEPWASVRPADVQLVLAQCAPGEVAIPGGACVDLCQYRANDSRTNMARRAIEITQSTFEAEPFSGDANSIKAYVKHATTEVEIAGPASIKTAPMYWRHWGKGGEYRKGFLQSDLIIATFSQHVTETVLALPRNSPMPLCDDPPIGALLLASQAVQRALKCFETGEFRAPPNFFSAVNYGDHYELVKGRMKLINRATKFVATLRRWPSTTWVDIRTRAEAYLALDSLDDDDASRATTPEAGAEEDSDDDEDFIMASDGEPDAEVDSNNMDMAEDDGTQGFEPAVVASVQEDGIKVSEY